MSTFTYSGAVPGDKFPVGTVVKLFTTTRPGFPPETGQAPTVYPWITDTGLTATVDSAGNLVFAGLGGDVSYILGQQVSSQWRYLQMPHRFRTAVDQAGQQAAAKASEGTVSVGAASTQLVAANPGRTGLYVSNTHATQDAYLSLGGTAISGRGIYLKAGGGSAYIADYTGVVNAIAAGAATGLSFSEV